jgi:hypothetical protein
MNGVLGKIVVGALTLVPAAGLFHVVENLFPQVQHGEISWMSVLLTASGIAAVSLALLVGLIVHAASNKAFSGGQKAAWITGFLVLLPVVGPVYWLVASIRGAAPSAAAS